MKKVDQICAATMGAKAEERTCSPANWSGSRSGPIDSSSSDWVADEVTGDRRNRWRTCFRGEAERLLVLLPHEMRHAGHQDPEARRCIQERVLPAVFQDRDLSEEIEGEHLVPGSNEAYLFPNRLE